MERLFGMPRRLIRRISAIIISFVSLCALSSIASAQGPRAQPVKYPWSDASLSPDQRADLVIKQMTLDEKISLLHGQGMPRDTAGPTESNGGAGFSAAIPRLGLPAIQMADSAYGVTRGAAAGRYSTVLPNNLAAASSWDPQSAFEYGALIGRELRNQGYSMSLGGGVNLAREPRDGRTFEYQGEDPLLAGTLVGNFIKGVQSEHLIGDVKHYALNDQESGRHAVNVNADKRTMRETDLLAFQIALEISDAGAVMCSYNRVNGDYACENSYLLDDVLRREFGFKGFVVSDWGATHSTAKSSHAGLDQEQPEQYFFGERFKAAVAKGEISQRELDQHVHRILRAVFATGLFDHPVIRQVPDVQRGLDVAQSIAEKSIVLLKNANGILPLNPSELRLVVLIGGHADKGVLTGGGSAQVDPPGGSPVPRPPIGSGFMGPLQRTTWLSDPPLRALPVAARGRGATAAARRGRGAEAGPVRRQPAARPSSTVIRSGRVTRSPWRCGRRSPDRGRPRPGSRRSQGPAGAPAPDRVPGRCSCGSAGRTVSRTPRPQTGCDGGVPIGGRVFSTA